MNRSIVITFVILLLLVGTGFFYFYQGSKKDGYLRQPTEPAGRDLGGLKGGEQKLPLTPAVEVEAMTISSTAFEENSTIPKKYTCDGEDVNPPLTFGDIPEEAKSLALIVDDPDAPAKVWSHWLLWNIPVTATEIKENSVPAGALQGKNDFGKQKYGGPCPPPGGLHRYRFKVFAVDTELDLPPSSTQKEVEDAIENHVISQATLVGTYGR